MGKKKTEPPRYQIRTVADFFNVPPDKRAHCAADFGMWLALVSDAIRHFEDTPGIVFPIDQFEWIDDGKHDAHVRAAVVSGANHG